MESELLILFIILLLGLILCSFLGGKIHEGMENNSDIQNNTNSTATDNSNSSNAFLTNVNFDNYNHYNGTSYPTIFYGPNGGTARVIRTPNNNTIVITNKNGTTEIYYIDKNSNNPDISTYYGPNGGSAKMISGDNGKQAVEITTPNGSKIIYTADNIYNNGQDDTINQYDSENNKTGTDYNTAYSSSTYYGPNGGKASTYTGPAGNTYATYDSSAYYNSLPQGIPRSQIPDGQEDLYILKTEVVPPVCPKCPDPIVQSPDNFDVTKCPPCPACKRCEEPSFECVKRPTYKAFNQDFMPMPVLNSFSTFGM